MDNNNFDFDRIAKAIDFISKNIKKQPSLEEVAEAVHLSPYHFQRMFTEWAGVSPKKFLQFLTIEYAKKVLEKSPSKTLAEAAELTGLSTTSRLHDLFVNIEGMTPGEYKNGGENLTIRYSIRNSQFGDYLIASTGKGISNLFFFDGEEKKVVEELKASWTNASIIEDVDEDQTKVARFFANDFNDSEKIKLHLKGTAFQIKVWEALLKIPQGALTSYGQIAGSINQANASRAVGTAIGSNPVGFIIPCHRVIKNVGGIGEFRWGSQRKKAMIGWEASQLPPY
ncbi:methylated-DNA--protein-cysteine methyltransferase [Sporocytophaga myxococcoides]|uniref:methylated-DNA--[protein]-cysteine S-methyltransferase n=1 Tax=Sporocytophaga myxococcoides TaxID=153721 RepID=A0A098LKC7_9BACT|nr:methylated-DNA--[protein]-cysteine S-methyltransferase [Sporocytophaga myxococcoides]GAL86643.1 methylated-DNA--protein-cysteine methyltransferase [Sporocytophaga myxococcoides]